MNIDLCSLFYTKKEQTLFHNSCIKQITQTNKKKPAEKTKPKKTTKQTNKNTPKTPNPSAVNCTKKYVKCYNLVLAGSCLEFPALLNNFFTEICLGPFISFTPRH